VLESVSETKDEEENGDIKIIRLKKHEE